MILLEICVIAALLLIVILLGKSNILKTNQIRALAEKENQSNLIVEEFTAKIQSLNRALEISEGLAIVTRQTENAVMLMDATGNIIWINDSFTKMYEYTYKEFTVALGTNIKKTSFNPEITERLNRCTSTKKSVTYEALNITKSGREIWTHTSLIPLLSNHNEVIGLVTIDSDIHKRIKAGQELIDHILSFNQKIEKISAELNVTVEMTDALFERIEKSQRRIDRTDQIVNYVKEIADQTKILGINASIEAHTAGEYGKGFRVIANEMVKISSITINSLKEINGLIDSIKRTSDKLRTEKEQSEQAISKHRALIAELKHEINEVEYVIQQLNQK